MTTRRLFHALIIASMCWVGAACDTSMETETTLSWEDGPAAPDLSAPEPTTAEVPSTAGEVWPTIAVAPLPTTPMGSPTSKARMLAKLKKVEKAPPKTKPTQTLSNIVAVGVTFPDFVRIEAAPCAGNPCLNQGRCIPGAYRYTCDCAPGYTGPRCEFAIQTAQLTPNYHGVLEPPTPADPCGDGVCSADEDGISCHEDCDGVPGVLCRVAEQVYDPMEDTYKVVRYHFDCDGTCATGSDRHAGNGFCEERYACDAFDQDGGDCVTCATDADCEGAVQPAHTHPDCLVHSCIREAQVCGLDAASFSQGVTRCGENDEGICWEGACERMEALEGLLAGNER